MGQVDTLFKIFRPTIIDMSLKILHTFTLDEFEKRVDVAPVARSFNDGYQNFHFNPPNFYSWEQNRLRPWLQKLDFVVSRFHDENEDSDRRWCYILHRPTGRQFTLIYGVD